MKGDLLWLCTSNGFCIYFWKHKAVRYKMTNVRIGKLFWKKTLLRNLALLNSTLLTSLVVYSSAKVYCEVYWTYLLLWLAAWHLLFAVKWVMAFIFLGPAEACLLVISCSFSVLTCSFVVCLLSSLSWVTDNEVWFCIDTSWTYCTLHC